MKIKKNNLLILSILLCISMLIIPTTEVNAAKFDKGSTKIYYSGASIANSGKYTYYNKKLDGSIAYCSQFKKKVPANGVSYSRLSKTNKYQKKALVAGQIITIGRSKYSGKEEYLYISEALNCYFKYNGYYKSACDSSKIKSLINTSEKYVDKYKWSSGSSKASLPKVTINYKASLSRDASASTSNNVVYKSGNVEVKGLNDSKYGSVGTKNTTSTVPTYTVNISSSASGSTAQLCNDSGCLSNGDKITKNGTYYIKVTKGGVDGGKVTLKISGSNKSTYPSAKRWSYSGGTQRLITKSSVDITRTVSAKATFDYSEADKYSVSITKVDDSGETLSGASLKLFTAADEEGKTDTVTLCETKADDADGSCSKKGMTENDENKYTNGRYICYSESTTPSGYVSIETRCTPINLSSSTEYLQINVATEEEQKISESDYKIAKSYEQGTDLQYKFNTDDGTKYNTSSTLYKYTYSDGRTPEYKTTNEENKHTNESGNAEWYIEKESGEKITITVTAIQGNQVCYNETAGENANINYCSGDYRFDSYTFTDGNAVFNVGNSLNYVNISKKTITGSDELQGATLAIYKSENGKCTNNLATAKRFVYSEYTVSDEDDSSSDSSEESESEGNTNTAGEETSDVDTEEGNDDNGDIASQGLTWISSDTAATVYGLAPGEYCLQEDIAPKGYKKSTTVVKFNMDESGKITTDSNDNYDNESNTLFIRNELTDITISKTDIATSKELPGAQLSICETNTDNGKIEVSTDESGDCTIASLANGELASWTSTNEPHKIEGLEAGTYYLVETTAPNGYTTAESILFTLKEDGTLVDKDGKSLADNKLVMQDKTIADVKTGQIRVIIACIIGLIAAVIALVVYNKKFQTNNIEPAKETIKLSQKIRKRKIRKQD
jgi:hypothetical protein